MADSATSKKSKTISIEQVRKQLQAQGFELVGEDAPAAVVGAGQDSPSSAVSTAGQDSANLPGTSPGVAPSVGGNYGAGTSAGANANPSAGDGTMTGLSTKGQPQIDSGKNSPAGKDEKAKKGGKGEDVGEPDMPSDSDMAANKKKKMGTDPATGSDPAEDEGKLGQGNFGLVTHADTSLIASGSKSANRNNAMAEGDKPAAAAETAATPKITVSAESMTTAIKDGIIEGMKSYEQKQLEFLSKQLGIEPKKAEGAGAGSSMVDDSALKANKEAVQKAVEFFQAIHDNPRGTQFPQHTWFVDKEQFMAERLYAVPTGAAMAHGAPQKVRDAAKAGGKEAVTISSGDLGQVFSKQILLIPGGRMFVPVRQYTDFTPIPNGADRANWYKIGAFDFDAITEGTEPANVSQTVTKIQAVPAVRGAVQRVGYSQIESSPFNLVQAINNAMALAGIVDEGTDLLDTVYNAVSPTNWINGNTGAAITSDDVSGMTLTAKAVLQAKILLMNQGYDTSPGNLVFFVHPTNYQQLLNDSNLQRYFQYARPDVTTTGILEMLFGVDIVVTNKVHAQTNATNNTYRNIMAVKGVAFAMASARDITLEAQRRNEVQQVILSGTQRVKGAVKEETATVRVSCAQSG